MTAISRQNLKFYWGMLDIKKVHPHCFLSYMMSPWTVYLTPPCSQICLNQIAGPRHIAHCTGLGPSLHSSSTTTKIQLNTNQTVGWGGALIKTIYAAGQKSCLQSSISYRHSHYHHSKRFLQTISYSNHLFYQSEHIRTTIVINFIIIVRNPSNSYFHLRHASSSSTYVTPVIVIIIFSSTPCDSHPHHILYSYHSNYLISNYHYHYAHHHQHVVLIINLI
jgi:hypothetical protein